MMDGRLARLAQLAGWLQLVGWLASVGWRAGWLAGWPGPLQSGGLQIAVLDGKREELVFLQGCLSCPWLIHVY